MTRAELIDEMATLGPLSHKQADVVVETILDSMKVAIAQGDRIEIRGRDSAGIMTPLRV